MARTLVGWTDAHYALDPNTNLALPNAAIDVQVLETGEALTDLQTPPGYIGQPFPPNQARTDESGFYGFTVPEGTGPVRVRVAATATEAPGQWLTPAGQVLDNGPVRGELAKKLDVATANATYLPLTQKGAASGLATLGASGDVPDGQLPASLPRLTAAKNVFTQKIEVNGASFVNAFDTALWVAPTPRTNPAVSTQGIYAQHRVSGDLGAKVHDAMAAELRVSGASNTSFLNAFEATAEVTGGANTIADMRAITANFLWSGAPTGTIAAASVVRAQAMPALPAGLTLDKAYGLYVEQQTRGGVENWSVYAPTGKSLFGSADVETSLKVRSGGFLDLVNATLRLRNASDSGTFMEIGPRFIRWRDAGMTQTTVGAAGAAAALPSAPKKYLQVLDTDGTTVLIPAFAAS